MLLIHTGGKTEMSRNSNSKRGFSLWALAILIMVGVCPAAQAQVQADGGRPGGVFADGGAGVLAAAGPRHP